MYKINSAGLQERSDDDEPSYTDSYLARMDEQFTKENRIEEFISSMNDSCHIPIP